MNTLLSCTAALALFCTAVPVSAPANASSILQRCVTPHGEDVYTDQPCARLDASASPLPARLLARITRDEAMEQRRNPLAGTVDASRPLDPGAIPIGRRSPASGCAKSANQLALDLRGALALGDVNRVAESCHWAGMSAKSGRHVMDRLQDLSTKKVMDSAYYGGGFSGLSDGATLLASTDGVQAGDTGILQLVLGRDEVRSVIDFDVHRYSGCYFVSF